MKLDLHTHISEATRYKTQDKDLVGQIVAKIKEKGLDGIAVTEHYDSAYGKRFKEMVDLYFPGQVLIIPGREIDVMPVQVVELYLPGEVTFRFLAHPGFPGDFTKSIDGLHGIEIENTLHSWHIKQDKVKELAEKHGLLLLHNSDAHSLDDIGSAHNELSIEELIAKARGKG